MTHRIVLAGLMLALTGASALAQQALPDGFDGKFRGSITAAGGEPGVEFTVVIRSAGRGFAVSWPTRASVRFVPADRPGLFVAKSNSRPLDGAPVDWARVAGGSLVVYSMQIDEFGGYHIDNFVYTPAKNGLDLVVRHVTSSVKPASSKGRLTRYGQ